MKIKVGSTAYHRNGINGQPFFTVFFTHEHDHLIATVTDEPGGCHVVNPDNPKMKYRGDNFEHDLRDSIIKYYAAVYKLTQLQARDELNDGLKDPVY